MDEVLKFIGSVVLAIIILGMPVLFALSLVFLWPAFIVYLLLVFTFIDLIGVSSILYDFTDF